MSPLSFFIRDYNMYFSSSVIGLIYSFLNEANAAWRFAGAIFVDNEHGQPQQKPMGGGYGTAGPQYNQNRGGGSLRGRFNPPANKAPFNSSSQNSNTAASQDQDIFSKKIY
uniref:Uncharacterized protein n=1 Tax=Panagrolaimus davidi TaxID=227884 RepID=A0A914QR51_9BILA